MIDLIFSAALVSGYFYLLLIIWSILRPQQRIWPAGKASWQLFFYWAVFYLLVGLTIALIMGDWNSWFLPASVRWGLGLPLALLGLGLVGWGIYALGLENTHGVRDGFITRGPYRFTRNPQYVGDIVMILGLILVANSPLATVACFLIILGFLLMPWAEEIWLEEEYGDEYLQYKISTPRFL